MTIGESGFLLNAPLARNGRRLNSAALDWFFFCDGSPLEARPALDPTVSRNPIKKGTVDMDNTKLALALKRELRQSGGSAAAKDGD